MSTTDDTRRAVDLLYQSTFAMEPFRSNERLAKAARDYLRPSRIVFRHLMTDESGRDVFEFGRDGEPLARAATKIRGVWWVWAAIDDAGRYDVLRAADFAAPDADEPEASARKGIRKTAAQWLARRMPELEMAALCIAISNGFIRYEAPASAPRIVTR